MTAAAPLIQGFFTQRLPQQRVSAHTIASYRDCFKLLLRFAQTRTSRPPAQLDLADLDAQLVLAFLDHLETDRHNGIDTRNLRLTAIQSFFRYAATRLPRTRRHHRPGAGHPSQETRPNHRQLPHPTRGRRPARGP